MRIDVILACLLLAAPLPAPLYAQGFAGMGTDADGFANPQPDPAFDFPADHGPHPEYRIEWWYLTANLDGPDGAEYGLQWTLFRSALAPGEKDGWQSPQVWFAHAAITTPDRHLSAERSRAAASDRPASRLTRSTRGSTTGAWRARISTISN